MIRLIIVLFVIVAILLILRSRSKINNKISKGALLVNYTGHGAQNVCVTGNFGSSHINQASNNGKYPFVISVACNNGTFTTGPCISEAWMLADKNNSPTGAISACGSSILMSWAPPMATQDEKERREIFNRWR